MKAMVFSLDSFMAFSIIVFAIFTIFSIQAYPKSYFVEFEQMFYLSRDTLLMLRNTFGNQTNLATDVFEFEGDGKRITHDLIARAIPVRFGFKIDKCELNIYDSDCSWVTLFDTKNNSDNMNLTTNLQRTTTCNRLASTSSVFIMDYMISPDMGSSAGCYINCDGFEGDCRTPCGLTTFVDDIGEGTMGLLRITVCS